MQRSMYVEDLAPGDRISVDGLHGVVRSSTPDGDMLTIELVNSSDENRDQITLATGTRVDVL